MAKLRKATISFVMSAAWNNLAQIGRLFMKFGIWIVFEKLSRKFKCP